MLFNNRDFDFSFFEIPGSDFKLEIDRNQFVNSKEGFLRGNMMQDEYEPYRNYSAIPFNPKNDYEQKLYKVMELDFALVDLNLYLDMHPEDKEAYQLFQNYVEAEQRAKKEFTEKYGPILFTNVNYQNYEWIKNPWPWDNIGGSQYV